MTRLDLLPENQLATLLKQAEDDIREIKNKQRHSGVSGLQGYFVQTNNTWDATGNITTAGPSFYDSRGYEVIFTSSGKQPFPVESIQLDIRFGGTGEANKPRELANGFWGYDDGAGNSGFMSDRNPTFDKSYSNNETKYRWTFDFSIAGNLNYYIKAYVAGTSDGTIVVNRVY